MRRVRIDDQLAAIPANALVQLFQAAKNADTPGDQYCNANLFAGAATQTALDAQIAGGNTSAPAATADGLTTGLIAATAQFLTPTVVTDANDILSLPAAVAGKTLRILAVACEVRSVVAGDKINGLVVGATNEALLVLGTLYTLVYDGVDNWLMTGVDVNGVVEAPRVPHVV